MSHPAEEPNIRVWTDTGPFEACVICTIRNAVNDSAAAQSWESRAGWPLCKTHTGMFDEALQENKIKVRLFIDIPEGSTAKVTELPAVKMLPEV